MTSSRGPGDDPPPRVLLAHVGSRDNFSRVPAFDRAEPIESLRAPPAIHGDMVHSSADGGRLPGIDRVTGAVRWEKRLPGPLWSIRVGIGDAGMRGDGAGALHGFDVGRPSLDPPWRGGPGRCIESGLPVWDGRIVVGSRAGCVHTVEDP